MQIKNLALIVAAGNGTRFGGEVPKQYLLLNGKPLLAHSIEAFSNHPQIDMVRVVIAKADEKLFKSLNLGVKYCYGGDQRQNSVRLGLESVTKLNPDNILIHDAARPYISAELISRIISALNEHDAAIPVVAVKDSVRVQGKAINRDEVFIVQTPQGFHYKRIAQAHNQLRGKNFTDDAQVADAAGIKLRFIEGEEDNKKITITSDLISPTLKFQVGIGFDVHQFETGTHVTICGIKIPHSHQLKGHSDADVGMHAIIDAILGSIGEGDIGEHFPPSDAKWRNVDSTIFLRHALQLVKNKGGEIGNIDVTIICEEPKLTTYKPQMKFCIAEILEISATCVNIKATTTEKLGFTGRNEGIAAQAVATVKFFG